MKPTFNVLFLFNRTHWDEAKKKEQLERIRIYFKPNVSLNIYAVDTKFSNVQWVPGLIDASNNGVKQGLLISETYFDNTFTKTALAWGWKNQIGVDIIVAVLDDTEWKGNVSQGMKTDCTQGMVQTYIKANSEKDGYWISGEFVETALFSRSVHEICHAIFDYLNIPDVTHLYLGNLGYPSRLILNDFKVNWTYTWKKTAWVRIRNTYRNLWNAWG